VEGTINKKHGMDCAQDSCLCV